MSETPAIDLNSDELKKKVEALKASLAAQGIVPEKKTDELTPEAQQARTEAGPEPDAITGADVNWDDYELDDKYAHLYRKARLVEGPKGPTWVADIIEYFSTSKNYSASSEAVAKNGEPMQLGVYITWMTNSPDGWKVAGVYPSGSGMAGVLFHRQVTVSLPDPVFIEKETKVDAPTDEELAAQEKKGLEWAGAAADEAVAALDGPDFGEIPEVVIPQGENDGSNGNNDPSGTSESE